MENSREYTPDLFVRELERQGYARTTRDTYRRVVARWLASRQPAEVWLRQEQDRSRRGGFASTAATAEAKAVRLFVRLAAAARGEDGATIDAAVDRIQAPRAHRYRRLARSPLSVAEEGQLRAALAVEGADPRLVCATWLLLGLGLRVGEVLALRLADLSTGADGPVLTVQEGKGRSLAAGDAPERLGLPGWLLGPLAAYLRGPRARLGGPWLLPSPRDPTRPWSERALRIALSRLGETIGLPAASADQPGAGLHPHRLRHTLATRLAEAGAARGEIKAVLRHRDSSVTGRYVHPGPGFVRAVLERLAPQG